METYQDGYYCVLLQKYCKAEILNSLVWDLGIKLIPKSHNMPLADCGCKMQTQKIFLWIFSTFCYVIFWPTVVTSQSQLYVIKSIIKINKSLYLSLLGGKWVKALEIMFVFKQVFVEQFGWQSMTISRIKISS